MVDDLITAAIIILLVGEMLWSLRCAWWMRHRYGRRLMRSAIWDRLVEGEIRTVAASVIMLLLVIHGAWFYLTETRFIQQPYGTVLLGAALALLLYGPIADKRLMERIEREGGDIGRPPLPDQDV